MSFLFLFQKERMTFWSTVFLLIYVGTINAQNATTVDVTQQNVQKSFAPLEVKSSSESQKIEVTLPKEPTVKKIVPSNRETIVSQNELLTNLGLQQDLLPITENTASPDNIFRLLSNHGVNTVSAVPEHSSGSNQVPPGLILIGGLSNSPSANDPTTLSSDILNSAFLNGHSDILSGSSGSGVLVDSSKQASVGSESQHSGSILLPHGTNNNGVLGLIDAGSVVDQTLNGLNDMYGITSTSDPSSSNIVTLGNSLDLSQLSSNSGIMTLTDAGILLAHIPSDMTSDLGNMSTNDTTGMVENGSIGQGTVDIHNLNSASGTQFSDLRNVLGIGNIRNTDGLSFVGINDGLGYNNRQNFLLDQGSGAMAGINDAILVNDPSMTENIVAVSDALGRTQLIDLNQYVAINNGQDTGYIDVVRINSGTGINQGLGLGDIVGMNDAFIINRSPTKVLGLNEFSKLASPNIVDLYNGQNRGISILGMNQGTNFGNILLLNDAPNAADLINFDQSSGTSIGPELVMLNDVAGTADMHSINTNVETQTTTNGTNLFTNELINNDHTISTLQSRDLNTEGSGRDFVIQGNVKDVHMTKPSLTSKLLIQDRQKNESISPENQLNFGIHTPKLMAMEQSEGVNVNTNSPSTAVEQIGNNNIIVENQVGLSDLFGVSNVPNGTLVSLDTHTLPTDVHSFVGNDQSNLMKSGHVISKGTGDNPRHYLETSLGTQTATSQIAGVEFITKSKSTKASSSESAKPLVTGNQIIIHHEKPISVKANKLLNETIYTLNADVTPVLETLTIPAVNNVKEIDTNATINTQPGNVIANSSINNTVMLSEVHESGTLLHILPGSSNIVSISDLKKAAVKQLHDTTVKDTGKQPTILTNTSSSDKMHVFDPVAMQLSKQTILAPDLLTESNFSKVIESTFHGTDVNYDNSHPFNETFDFPINDTYIPDFHFNAGSNALNTNESYIGIDGKIISKLPAENTGMSTNGLTDLSNETFTPQPLQSVTSTGFEWVDAIPPVVTQPSVENGLVPTEENSLYLSGTEQSVAFDNQVHDPSVSLQSSDAVIHGTTSPNAFEVTGPILIENTDVGIVVNGLKSGQTTNAVPTTSVSSIDQYQSNIHETDTGIKSNHAQISTRATALNAFSGTGTISSFKDRGTTHKISQSSTKNEPVVLNEGSQYSLNGINENGTVAVSTRTENARFDINNRLKMKDSSGKSSNKVLEASLVLPHTKTVTGENDLNVGVADGVKLIDSKQVEVNVNTIKLPQVNTATDQLLSSASTISDVKPISNDIMNNIIDPKTNVNRGLTVLPDTEVILGDGIDFRTDGAGNDMFIIGDSLSLANDHNYIAENLTRFGNETTNGTNADLQTLNDGHNFHDFSAVHSFEGGFLPSGSDMTSNETFARISTSNFGRAFRLSGEGLGGETFIIGDGFGILDLMHVDQKTPDQLANQTVTANFTNYTLNSDSVHGTSFVVQEENRKNGSNEKDVSKPFSSGSFSQITLAPNGSRSIQRNIGSHNIIDKISVQESITSDGNRFILSKLLDPNDRNNELILIQHVESNVSNVLNNSSSHPLVDITPNITDSLKVSVGEIQSDPIAVTDRFGAENNIFSMSPNTFELHSVDSGNSLRMPVSPIQSRLASTGSPGSPNQVIMRLSKSIGLGDLFGATDVMPGNDLNITSSTSMRNQTLGSSTIDFSTNIAVPSVSEILSQSDGFNTINSLPQVITTSVGSLPTFNNSSQNSLVDLSMNEALQVSSPFSATDGFVQSGLEPNVQVDGPQGQLLADKVVGTTTDSSATPSSNLNLVRRRIIIPPMSRTASTSSRGTSNAQSSIETSRVLELPTRSGDRRPVLAFFSPRDSSPRRSLILLRRRRPQTSSESPTLRTPTSSARVDARRLRFRGVPLIDRLAQRPRPDVSRYLVPPRFIRPRGSMRRGLSLSDTGSISRRPSRIATLRRPLMDNDLPSTESVGISSTSTRDSTSPRIYRGAVGSLFGDSRTRFRPLSARRFRSRTIRPLRTRRPPPVGRGPPLLGPPELPPPPPFPPF